MSQLPFYINLFFVLVKQLNLLVIKFVVVVVGIFYPFLKIVDSNFIQDLQLKYIYTCKIGPVT